MWRVKGRVSPFTPAGVYLVVTALLSHLHSLGLLLLLLLVLGGRHSRGYSLLC